MKRGASFVSVALVSGFASALVYVLASVLATVLTTSSLASKAAAVSKGLMFVGADGADAETFELEAALLLADALALEFALVLALALELALIGLLWARSGISIAISTDTGRGWVSKIRGKTTTPMKTSTQAPIKRWRARRRMASTLSDAGWLKLPWGSAVWTGNRNLKKAMCERSQELK